MNLAALPPLLKVAAGLAIGAAFAGSVALIASRGDNGPPTAFNAGTIGQLSPTPIRTPTPTPFVEHPLGTPRIPPLEPTLTPAPTPANFACPSGWASQNNAATHYLFCTPPGWVVTFSALGSLGGSGLAAGGQATIINAEQAKVAGPRAYTAPG